MIKLIVIFALLLIIALIVWGVTPDYEKCYSDMEYKGYASMGCCGGLTGGTKDTDYLSETCCSCPHLVLGCDPIRKRRKRMKIIKKGIRPTITKRFICKNCGCIWEAEKGEYNITSYLGMMHDGLKAFNMKCPCCGAFVDAD